MPLPSRPSRVAWVPVLVASGVACAGPARSQLLLNEILYDPSGSDAGKEWVEIYNSGPWPAPTAGLTLQFANGADPETWRVVWTGSDSLWIDSESYFVIGARTDGPVDSEAELGLQNGPDALRLGRDGFVLDLVGWGEPLDPGLSEGAPAPLVASGECLARIDGLDTDDNARDFRAARPTPGRRNHAEIDVRIALRAPGRRALPLEEAAARLDVVLEIGNEGRRAVPLELIDLTLSGNRVALEGPPLQPGEVLVRRESAAVVRTLELDAGTYAHVSLRGDENAENDRDSLVVATAPAPVRIVEIHARPLEQGAEWVELEVREPIALHGWTLADASGGACRIVEEGQLGAGLEVLSANGGPATLSLEGWPSLNDQAGADGIADSLFLVDARGRIRDWALFGESEAGVSWVRLSGPPLADPRDLWTLDRAHPGGTPGAPPADELDSLHPVEGGLSLETYPAGSWLDLPEGTRAYALDVFDLTGRLVDRASGATRARRIRWPEDGGPGLAGGVYVLHLRAETDRGDHAERRTVVVER